MRRCASAPTAVVIAGALLVGIAARAGAGGGITPGVAAGGVPLTADVQTVMRILGRPTRELQDPTNGQIYIQRWEALCLGARYTPQGTLLALDVWFDLGEVCSHPEADYRVEGRGGQFIGFRSTRGDVKRVFGYRPDRVVRAPRFTLLVYDTAGVAFYIREGGTRNGWVDAMTVFSPDTSLDVWLPEALRRR